MKKNARRKILARMILFVFLFTSVFSTSTVFANTEGTNDEIGVTYAEVWIGESGFNSIPADLEQLDDDNSLSMIIPSNYANYGITFDVVARNAFIYENLDDEGTDEFEVFELNFEESDTQTIRFYVGNEDKSVLKYYTFYIFATGEVVEPSEDGEEPEYLEGVTVTSAAFASDFDGVVALNDNHSEEEITLYADADISTDDVGSIMARFSSSETIEGVDVYMEYDAELQQFVGSTMIEAMYPSEGSYVLDYFYKDELFVTMDIEENPSFTITKDFEDKEGPSLTRASFTLNDEYCEEYGFTIAPSDNLEVWVEASDDNGVHRGEAIFRSQNDPDGYISCGLALHEETGKYFGNVTEIFGEVADEKWYLSEIHLYDNYGNENVYTELNGNPLSDKYFYTEGFEGNWDDEWEDEYEEPTFTELEFLEEGTAVDRDNRVLHFIFSVTGIDEFEEAYIEVEPASGESFGVTTADIQPTGEAENQYMATFELGSYVEGLCYLKKFSVWGDGEGAYWYGEKEFSIEAEDIGVEIETVYFDEDFDKKISFDDNHREETFNVYADGTVTSEDIGCLWAYFTDEEDEHEIGISLEYNEETGRFESEKTLDLSYNAGTYVLAYMEMSGHYVPVTFGERPSFTVEKSLSDTQAPVLEEVYFTLDGERCEDYGFTVTTGHKIEVWADVKDASGVSSVIGTLRHEVDGEGGFMFKMTYDDETGLYYRDLFSVLIGETEETWILTEFDLEDEFGNYETQTSVKNKPLNGMYFYLGEFEELAPDPTKIEFSTIATFPYDDGNLNTVSLRIGALTDDNQATIRLPEGYLNTYSTLDVYLKSGILYSMDGECYGDTNFFDIELDENNRCTIEFTVKSEDGTKSENYKVTVYVPCKKHENWLEKAEAEYLKSAATCTAKAVYYKSCAVCGEKGEATFTSGSMEKHDMQNKVDAKYLKSAATCTAKAVYYKSCSVCGTKDTATFETGSVAKHNMQNKVDAKYLKSAATCTSAAVYYKSCAACGQKDADTFTNGSAAGHKMVVVSSTTPTCTSDGVKTLKCACGETKIESNGKATGHKIVTLAAKAATCTETGLTEGQKCESCQTVIKAQSTVGKIAHTTATTDVMPATLKDNGAIVEKCACGETVNTTTIAKIKTVKFAKTTAVYTGKALKPAVTVTDVNGDKIAAANYKVTYKNNKAVGTATATVTFTGSYQGTKTIKFTVTPKAPVIKKPVAAKKAVTVKWTKVAKKVSGYEVLLATNNKFTKGKKSATIKKATTISKKVTGLKSKKIYYVKVRAYKTVKGKKIYSNWSGVKKVKTK